MFLCVDGVAIERSEAGTKRFVRGKVALLHGSISLFRLCFLRSSPTRCTASASVGFGAFFPLIVLRVGACGGVFLRSLCGDGSFSWLTSTSALFLLLLFVLRTTC